MYSNNDGSRTLVESTMAPEIINALNALAANNFQGVLIGGLAVSYHTKPRMTSDIGSLFKDEQSIPNELNGFKKIRDHAFRHNKTHVEVEVLTPQFLNNDIPVNVANHIIATAIEVNGLRIASKSGLVAAKLGRASYQDKHDIIELIKSGGVDIAPYGLEQDKIELFNSLKSEVQ